MNNHIEQPTLGQQSHVDHRYNHIAMATHHMAEGLDNLEVPVAPRNGFALQYGILGRARSDDCQSTISLSTTTTGGTIRGTDSNPTTGSSTPTGYYQAMNQAAGAVYPQTGYGTFPADAMPQQLATHPQREDPKQQICFDFTKGQCSRGAACKFSHDINLIIRVNSQEKGICFDFLKGTCHRGVLCRFSHDLQNLQTPLAQTQAALAVASATPRSRSMAPICYDFVKGQCNRGDECRYSHDYASILYGPKPQAKDPFVICVDFTRGRCTRGAYCRYRHEIPMTNAAVSGTHIMDIDPALVASGLGGGFNTMAMNAMSNMMSGGGGGADPSLLAAAAAAGYAPLSASQQQHQQNAAQIAAMAQAILSGAGGINAKGPSPQQNVVQPQQLNQTAESLLMDQLQRMTMSDHTAAAAAMQYPASDAMSALTMAFASAQQQQQAGGMSSIPLSRRPTPTNYPQHAQQRTAQSSPLLGSLESSPLDSPSPIQTHSPPLNPINNNSAGAAAMPPAPALAPVLTKSASSTLRTSASFKQGVAGSTGTFVPGTHNAVSPHEPEFGTDSPTIQAAWGSGSFQSVKSIWDVNGFAGPLNLQQHMQQERENQYQQQR